MRRLIARLGNRIPLDVTDKGWSHNVFLSFVIPLPNPNYSTWEGKRGIYLEELYVRPSARRRGIGRELILHLARELKRIGGARLDLSVLDWNQPARDFYAALGFDDQQSWRPYRMTGEALARAAGQP